MRIERQAARICIAAPAKLNLFLEILGKLEGGYHKIETLMCPVDLCDSLVFEPTFGPDIHFVLETPPQANRTDPAWDIPENAKNLVVRAISEVRDTFAICGGCTVKLQKSIPAQAGLGGGSSDAAAAIVASMAGWGKWSRDIAEKIASRLGSDIKFFLGDAEHGVGLARGTGRGEIVEVLAHQPKLSFVISHPAEGCSTAQVYSLCKVSKKPQDSTACLAACARATCEDIGPQLYNALQEPATRISHWIMRQLESLHKVGAKYALMTGSGSACYALAENRESAERMTKQLRTVGMPRVFAADAWYARSIESQLGAIG